MYNADPELAYKQAKEVLQKNNGNRYRIKNAIIKHFEHVYVKVLYKYVCMYVDEWSEVKTDDAGKPNNLSHCLT